MAQLSGPFPEMPKGIEVASFSSYDDASKGVEKLGNEGFPLTSVTIVGSDLHIVEEVVGKLTPARVALAGATQGLTWGLLFGLMLFFLLGDLAGFFPLLGILFGVLLGVIMAIIPWAISPKKKSFAARTQMVASRYAILVSEQADLAFRLLGGIGSPRPRVRPARPAEPPSGKPAFGVRLSPEERRLRDRNSTAGASPKGASASSNAPKADSAAGEHPVGEQPVGEHPVGEHPVGEQPEERQEDPKE